MICPVHVARVMTIEAQAPLGARRKRAGALDLEGEAVDERVIVRLRCPVEKCPQVGFVILVGKRERRCPRCGKKSDANPERQVIGDHRCKSCARKTYARWNEERRARRRRCGGSSEA